jgi:nucleoside-diphosphate-sugar epimerase
MGAATEDSPKVLLTGADGFVGRHMQRALSDRGMHYRVAVRQLGDPPDPRRFEVGDIGPRTDWRAALDGIDVVVHLAGRAHILRETAADPRAEFMRVNAEGTAALATSALAAGVRRLVYVSSIGVHGNTSGSTAFTVTSPLQPHNAYAESKLAGEIAARSVAGKRLEVVVLRLPLVYGPGVRANFLRLLQWVDRGWPLPLAAIENRRSLVNVWNLCDLLANILKNPVASGHTWMVSDGEDLSTPDLMRRIGSAMGRRVRLLAVPERMLWLCGALTGRQREIAQLCGSLAVDIEHTRIELGWHPPVTVDEAIARTVEWYVTQGGPPCA